MSKPPKQRTAEFKFKLVLEALAGNKTMTQLAAEHQIHPKQIQRWKNQFLEEGPNVFSDKRIQKELDPDSGKLIHVIDQLTKELDFVRKKLKRSD